MSTSKRDKVTRVPVESSRRVRVSRYPCRRPLWAAAGGGAHLTCSDDPPAPPLHSTPTGGAEGTVGGNRLSHRLCSCDYSLEYPRNKKSFRAAAERRSAGAPESHSPSSSVLTTTGGEMGPEPWALYALTTTAYCTHGRSAVTTSRPPPPAPTPTTLKL